ncbi:uncharacterized protein LOC143806667 [Ranitomeya variabilis]|uniref:uncharacterized protein LOC143806667 n=1 Tax=Ranitomeya variabilis TaxID=490064 RepID=UPI0040579FA3
MDVWIYWKGRCWVNCPRMAREITFLDLKIFPYENGLATNLFRKPTATNALLDFSSSSKGVTPDASSLQPIKEREDRTRSPCYHLEDNVGRRRPDSSPTLTTVGSSFLWQIHQPFWICISIRGELHALLYMTFGYYGFL